MRSVVHQILQQYWGYKSFRPLQEEIIMSVMSGKDTLALLPTGGGKSITYQVPALARDGLCLVISPLIALMKDQVENLRKRNIVAYAIHSGLNFYETENILNNCLFGNVKFLYVSPERLETEMFLLRLPKMKLNLIAVDEAHCISQWGFDFRPPYRNISAIRKLVPNVPVLAVTATATQDVANDIMEQLSFREKNEFRQSFFRDNLSYNAINEENKTGRLLQLLNEHSGTAIVYVRNRKKTREYAEFLRRNGISAHYYHAGLLPVERDQRQSEWLRDKVRVMTATNAFGMGIDKPNVRLVVHLDLPDCIEAYFQEAGRGGRDGLQSQAWLLYSASDIIESEKMIEASFPEPDFVSKIYNALGNYFQVVNGTGKLSEYNFEIADFCAKFALPAMETFNAIKLLEKDGYIAVSDAFYSPSRLKMLADKAQLYRFQLENKALSPFIELILRSYPGLFTDFVRIDEFQLARRMNADKSIVIKGLKELDRMGLLTYSAASNSPRLTWLSDRIDHRNIVLSAEHYHQRKKNATERFNAVKNFIGASSKCRSQLLLDYFGEKQTRRCGVCDVCQKRSETGVSEYKFNEILAIVKPLLKQNRMSMNEILKHIPVMESERAKSALTWMLDNGKIGMDDDDRLFWL